MDRMQPPLLRFNYNIVCLFTVLIGSVNCAKNDCTKIKKPDTITKDSAELQTWDHQDLENFYIFPNRPNNAVIRIKGFGNTKCKKTNVVFKIGDVEDTKLVCSVSCFKKLFEISVGDNKHLDFITHQIKLINR